MGTAYDLFLKKANVKAKQNRVNRVVKRTQSYGRGLGKSHKQYIAGDIVSSAKNTAYGNKMNGYTPLNQFTGGQDPYLRKQQQEGYNPYEFKYVYTGTPTWVKGGTSARGKKYEGFWSRNRMATDEEKDLYKKTGNLDFNQAKSDSSYAIMRSHDANAKMFKDQLNTSTWDGLDVAKKRVNNGSSKFEYLKGFLKDVVADPVFDALKTFDYGESALTGGIAGAIEESRNVFDAISENDISKIDFMRPIKNISESVEHSEKTGWGKSMSQYFSEAVDRQDKEELDRLNSLPQDTFTKLQIKNIKDKQNNKANKIFETAVGFAGDIGSPIHLGTGMARVGKKITGDAVNSFNDLRRGTADLSMGIVPKHIREANQKKAIEIARKNMEDIPVKKTSNVLDTLHESKPMNDLKMFEDNALEHSLNKGFNRAMDNDVDKVIKSNPATQNLGNFLDNMKPQKSSVIDDFENIFESSDVPNSKLGKDIFFKKIDDLPDRESDEVLDWLSEYNPKVYDEYLGDVDNLDKYLDGLVDEIKTKDIFDDKIANEMNHRYLEGTNQNSLSPEIAKRYDAFNLSLSEQEKVNNAYNELQKYRMLNNNKSITSKIRPPEENMKTFVDKSNEFVENISQLDTKSLGELSELIDSFTKVDNNLRRDEIVSHLNDLMFNGEKVLLNTITPKHLEQLTTHLADLVDYKLAKANGSFSFKPRVPADNTKDGVHYFTGKNGKENKFFSKFNMYAPTGADELFNTKMSDLASFFEVKSKSELTKPLSELRGKLRKGEDLTPDELNEYNRLSELVDRWDDLYKGNGNIKNMDFDQYQKFRKENLGIKDGYEDYVEKHMKEYSDTDVNRKDFIKNIEDGRGSRNKTGKQTYEKQNPYQSNDFADDMYKPKDAIEEGYIKAEKDEIFKQQRIYEELADLHKELNIPLPKVKNSNVKISPNQKLNSIPDVTHNTSGLRKVIENEMEMMHKNPTKYEKHKSTLQNMKKEFVSALRSYGVKDEQYFKKVKALQDDLDLYYKELNKPSSIVKNTSEGGQGTPSLGMNLQLLARRINKGLDDLDLENFQTLTDRPINSIESLQRRSHKAINKVDVEGKTAQDYEAFIDEDSNVLSNFLNNHVNENIEKPIKQIEEPSKIDEFANGFDEFNQKTNKFVQDPNLPNAEKSLVDELGEEQEMYDIINKIGKKYGGEDVKPPSFDEFKSNFKSESSYMKYEDSKIYDIYKRWLNTWKKGLTVYNPGWHVQNFFQNKGQNYLALGGEAFGSQKNARRLLSYMQGGKNKVEDVVDLKNGKIYSGDDLKALVKRNKVVNSQTNDIIESRGVISPLETKIDNSWIMEKLGHSEDTARLHHFIKQLERGMSPEDATKSVNKYLFDYNNKTKFDKVMGDFVDPFWTFHKNYAKLLGKSAIENPSAINNILRGERGLENGLSENDRNSTSKTWDFIQSPHNSFKDDKNGKMYDFLYKQKLMPRIQDAIPTNMDDAENKLNPILRLALQQSRNEGNFHNKVVDKDKAGWNEVTKEDRNKEIALELNPFINSFAKAVKNSNKRQKSADEGKQSQSTSDKQAFYDWVQFITGVKGNYYRR